MANRSSDLRFVGRDREFDALDRVLDVGPDEQPSIAFVAGPGGVGKSRLLREFAERARIAGSVVWVGYCDEQPLRPYQPFADALATSVRRIGSQQARHELGALAERLAPLIPQWSSNDERSGAIESRDLPAAAGFEDARIDLSEAFVEWIDRSAAAATSVLVIEDLHWSDAATRHMFRHVAASNMTHPLAIIVTLRPFETLTSDVSNVVGTMMRRDGTHLIELEGLDEKSLEMLVRSGGFDDAAELSPRLYERTRGNALFATQLIAHARAGGSFDAVPTTVRQLITQRLRELGPDTLRVLEHAAVIGSRFEYALLEGSVDLFGGALLDSVESATAAGLLTAVTSPEPTYEFSHALVRDAITDAIASPTRARLHRAVAEALIRSGADTAGDYSRAVALARHWTFAEGVDAVSHAVRFASEAAEQAMDSVSPEDALQTLTAALERVTPRAGVAPELLVRAWLLLAEANEELGLLQETRAASEVAARIARGTSREAFLEAVYIRAMSPSLGQPDTVASALIAEALALVGDSDPYWRARLLRARVGDEFFGEGRPDKALATVEQALAVAEQLGDPAVLGDVYGTMSFVVQPLPDVQLRFHAIDKWKDCIAACRDAPTNWRHGAQPRSRFSALRAEAQVLLETGDAAFARALQAASDEVDEERSRYARRAVTAFETSIHLMRGRFDVAEPHIIEGLSLASTLTDETAIALGQFFLLRREQGRIDEVLPLAVDALRDRPGLRALEPALALGHCDRGDLQAARDLLDDAPRNRGRLPRDTTWIAGSVVLAEVFASLQMRDVAATLYQDLAPYSGRVAVVGVSGAVIGAVDRALGMLALTLDDTGTAVAKLESGLATEQTLGARPLVARSQYWLARAVLASSPADVVQADSLLGESIATAESLGMTTLASQARELFVGSESALLTLVFTDIVDSTPLAAQFGNDAWRRILDDHERTVRAIVERHGGRVVDSTGDGFLSEFASPARAVRAAEAIVRQPGHPALRVRAGAHTGEVTRRGAGLSGVTVHIAARVAAQAGGGEVVVSRIVADLAATSAMHFRSIGVRSLKGVAGDVELLVPDVEPSP